MSPETKSSQFSKKESSQKPDTMIAYVHNLSPPRRNRQNMMDYSTLTLQTSSGQNEQALLFSKHKRKLLLDHETSRRPVKIQKFTKTSDGQKVIINEMTKLSVPRPDEYGFQFQKVASSTPIECINMIKDLEDGTEIIVRGKVHSIGEPRYTGAKRLQVCEISLGDSTGVVKVNLWEDFISKFEIGHCYTISPVQVRSWMGKKKISTVIYSDVVEICDDQELLDLEAPVEGDDAANDDTVTVQVKSIDLIDKIDTFLRCDKCGKKVLQLSSSDFAHCDYCGRHMRTAKCKKDVCVKFCVESNFVLSQIPM